MNRWLWSLTWVVFRPILKFFCHFEVVGEEKLRDLKGPVVLAIGVHGHRLDPWIVSAAMPYDNHLFPIRFMTAQKYMDVPVLGWVLRQYGAFPVRRGLPLEQSLEESIRILNNGEVIGVFPEGRLSATGELAPGKVGVAYIAKTTNVPVVTVALSGSFGLSLWKFLTRRNTIRVVFSEPMYIRDESLDIAVMGIMNSIRLLLPA